jgi:RNA polymerase sigma factor (sigma-70 family)
MAAPISIRPPPDPSTADLVRRCLRGERGAWDALVDRYVRLVYAVGVRHGLAHAEAEDVAQEVFLALAQSLHTIEEPERLPSWLMTTTRRLCWRTLQKERREQPIEAADLGNDEPVARAQPLIATLPSIEEMTTEWQRQEVLAAGLARLGERCRALLTQLFLDESEPSYDAISQATGLPKGSIGPTRIRCLQQLRSILEGLGFDGM